jgi:asparagine synthase (glutamine-hydrolysing)
MSCLFGYYGKPEDGLLQRMAGILEHRCHAGWERADLSVRDGHVVEIGHGIPPWADTSTLAGLPAKGLLFGHSGVIFNLRDVLERAGSSANLRLEMQTGEVVRSSHAAKPQRKKIFRRPSEPATSLDESTVSILSAVLVQEPERILESLEGAFVAALAHGDQLNLVRDPAGVKVLYWTKTRDRILFASEIKALFADEGVERRMRVAALPEYLTFSFVPGEGTMFEGIYELQPGTILRYKGGEVTTRRFFAFEDHEWHDGSPGNEDHYAERVRADLEESVRECQEVNGRSPAVFLSGGIDSSSVLAVAARRRHHPPIKTFSVHFGPGYVNENEFVSMMVSRYQTDHTYLEIKPSRFLKRMREIMWILDDPIGDPITVPNFLLAETASQVSNVVLNGEGGDPCFGGPKNIPMVLSRLYGPIPGQNGRAWEERNYLLSYRKCFSDLSRILNPSVWEQAGGEEALTSIISPFLNSPKPKSFLNKLMAINIRLKGANLILVKVDKMTSANGVLALPPLFSKRLIETSMACPPGLKLRGNIEKGILKQAVQNIVPEAIVQRPKVGMMVPVRFWLRGEMRRYAKKVLSRRNLSRVGLFDVDYARRLLDYDRDEVQGARHGLKLWMLITFMLWYEQMME